MSQRRGIYFTSDWHVGHANVIKYDKRPFKDVEHMHRVLINNYNAIVGEGDVCYFVGDMGLCKFDTLKNIVSQLNGTKILILGNHDRNMESMYKVGFDVVMYGAVLWIAKENVTISHCPMIGAFAEDTTGMKGTEEGDNWYGETRERFQKFSTINNGQFHLHGHSHVGPENTINGRQYNVNVTCNKYRPVHISKIESWIAITKKAEQENGNS